MITTSDLSEKIKNIIAEQLGLEVESIVNTSHFVNDLGADSLDTVELLMAFEEEFGITIDDDEAEKLQTLQDVINFLESRKV